MFSSVYVYCQEAVASERFLHTYIHNISRWIACHLWALISLRAPPAAGSPPLAALPPLAAYLARHPSGRPRLPPRAPPPAGSAGLCRPPPLSASCAVSRISQQGGRQRVPGPRREALQRRPHPALLRRGHKGLPEGRCRLSPARRLAPYRLSRVGRPTPPPTSSPPRSTSSNPSSSRNRAVRPRLSPTLCIAAFFRSSS